MEQKNSVLIVDDEISNLQVLNHMLGSDYMIYTAKNGVNALEKAREYAPDLILLDIVMPGMDGYQVLEELRKMKMTSKIPVIFITGLSSVEDEKIGLSLNAADYISKPFSPMIVKLRVRNQLQIVNQLRTIERLIMQDQLTGMANRNSFDERMEMEWKRARRENVPISILFMDIDNFKAYNEFHGHRQGDAALRAIASVIMRSLKRSSDFAARWDDEEFAALLPNTSLEGALKVAKEIRRNAETAEIVHENGANSNVTISIGVSVIVPSSASSVDAFISKADQALRSAKAAGKNKVAYEIFSE